jgi:predicted ABC-type ATPase
VTAPAARRTGKPSIYVLAGVNGAGKSSVGGATFRRNGADYFNPDEATQRILEANPGISLEQANSAAWLEGKRLLERAIAERLDFAFETTLGGNTIARLLERATQAGIEVRVWFVGLSSPELHIARVRACAAAGGHDIPDAKIRERFDASRLNLIRLLPKLTELRVYDNSADGDPIFGAVPQPRLIVHVVGGSVRESCPLEEVPEWAKPIVLAALRLSRL